MNKIGKQGETSLPTQSKREDILLALLLAGLVAISPFSIDVYLPAIPSIALDLSTNIHRVELSLGLFLMGLAIGQLIGGPTSDFRGRRTIAISGLFVFMVASFLCVYSKAIDQLLFLRFVQGFGAGFASVVAMATVRDRYEGAVAAKMFALIGIIMMVAPLVAPIIGSIILNTLGWRYIFWALGIYSILVAFLMIRYLPKKVEATYTQAVKSNTTVIGRTWQQYITVFKQRKALGYLFFQAFSFASMFAFLTESAFVYMELYGISDEIYPVVFGLNIIVMAIFNRVTAYRLSHQTPNDLLKIGVAMQIACNVTIFILALFGMPPFLLLLAFIMLSVGSQGLIVANTMSCYMAYFSGNSGTANGVLGVSQFSIGALVGWLTTVAHNGTLLPMASMMLLSSLAGFSLLYYFSWRNNAQ